MQSIIERIGSGMACGDWPGTLMRAMPSSLGRPFQTQLAVLAGEVDAGDRLRIWLDFHGDRHIESQGQPCANRSIGG